MAGHEWAPLFKGAVANAETKYVGVPIHNGILGVQIGWLDATSSATITLELSSFTPTDAPVSEAGSAWEWKDSGQTITGPAASAAGSTLVNLENVRQRRARLKIVGAAACVFEIHAGALMSIRTGIRAGLNRAPQAGPDRRVRPLPVLLTQGKSTTAALVYSTDSVTIPAKVPVYVAIGSNENAASGRTPTSVVAAPSVEALAFTACGTPFDYKTSQSQRLSWWRACSPVAVTGVITITYLTTNQLSIVWVVQAIYGADPSGLNGAASFIQATTGATGVSGTITSGTLAALEHPNNICLAANGTSGTGTMSSTTFTEIGEIQEATPTINIQTQYLANARTSVATVSAGTPDWGLMVLEVKSQ